METTLFFAAVAFVGMSLCVMVALTVFLICGLRRWRDSTGKAVVIVTAVLIPVAVYQIASMLSADIYIRETYLRRVR